jgi:hypothetical protein
VVIGADDACVGPTSGCRADGGGPSSDPKSCISLFTKINVVMSSIDVRRSVANLAQ